MTFSRLKEHEYANRLIILKQFPTKHLSLLKVYSNLHIIRLILIHV